MTLLVITLRSARQLLVRLAVDTWTSPEPTHAAGCLVGVSILDSVCEFAESGSLSSLDEGRVDLGVVKI